MAALVNPHSARISLDHLSVTVVVALPPKSDSTVTVPGLLRQEPLDDW